MNAEPERDPGRRRGGLDFRSYLAGVLVMFACFVLVDTLMDALTPATASADFLTGLNVGVAIGRAETRKPSESTYSSNTGHFDTPAAPTPPPVVVAADVVPDVETVETVEEAACVD